MRRQSYVAQNLGCQWRRSERLGEWLTAQSGSRRRAPLCQARGEFSSDDARMAGEPPAMKVVEQALLCYSAGLPVACPGVSCSASAAVSSDAGAAVMAVFSSGTIAITVAKSRTTSMA
jgi:hypothetical protein